MLMIVGIFYGITLFLPLFLRMLGGWGEGIGSILIILLPILVFTAAGRTLFAGNRRGGQNHKKKPFLGGHIKEKWPTLIKPLAGILSAVVILIWNPVSDWFYYIGAFVCMGTVLWAIMDIISQHNLLTTRKLLQLGRRGGDEVG